MKLGHKLVDIGTAFNPRIDERIQFGLKYYSYLLFELNDFQRKKHSPTSDAIMTLWIYYYTMAQEGTGLKWGKKQPNIISRLYIANLLNNFIATALVTEYHIETFTPNYSIKIFKNFC